jgi:hypothetical protein
MIGPITKHAILGVIFGVTALPIAAALSHQLSIGGAVVAGFAGGLVGGTAWGALKQLAARKRA